MEGEAGLIGRAPFTRPERHERMTQDNGSAAQASPLTLVLRRIVQVRPAEVRALLLGCAYYFTVLTAYYIIRPIRDQMGLAGGVRNLPWLFTGTMTGMILVNPLFSALVARYPRRRFVPMAYRFFMLNLLLFFLLLRLVPHDATVWVGRVFFMWVSIFNLFVVSVFWSFMADVFTSEQGKRLFAFVALGGTLGAVLGASITALFVELVGQTNLLLISIAFLQLAIWCAAGLGRAAGASEAAARSAAGGGGEESARGDTVIGGGMLAGIGHVLRSPYLLGICLFILLYTIGSTIVYFQQAGIIDASVPKGDPQTALFARIDLMVNALTIVMQLYVTGRIARWLGVGITLAVLPALSIAGFTALALMPVLGVIVAFQVVRRAGEYAVTRPMREVLYTVINREDKYKAKNFIDTFVYRAGDQIGAWSSKLIGALGLTMVSLSWVAVPLSALWLVIGLWLGKRQEAMARAQRTETPPGRAAEPVPA